MLTLRQVPATNTAGVQWLRKDETTYHLENMDRKDRWQYYVSSFSRVEDTEGINRTKMDPIFQGQLAKYTRQYEDDAEAPSDVHHGENLILRICVNTSKIIYKAGTQDSHTFVRKAPDSVAAAKRTESRNRRFHEKFVQNNAWMKGKSHEEVQNLTAEFKKQYSDDTAAADSEVPVSDVAGEADADMED